MKIDKPAKVDAFGPVITPSLAQRGLNLTTKAVDAILGKDVNHGDIEVHLVAFDPTADVLNPQDAWGVKIKVLQRYAERPKTTQGFRLKRVTGQGRTCGHIAGVALYEALANAFRGDWKLRYNESRSTMDEIVFGKEDLTDASRPA